MFFLAILPVVGRKCASSRPQTLQQHRSSGRNLGRNSFRINNLIVSATALRICEENCAKVMKKKRNPNRRLIFVNCALSDVRQQPAIWSSPNIALSRAQVKAALQRHPWPSSQRPSGSSIAMELVLRKFCCWGNVGPSTSLEPPTRQAIVHYTPTTSLFSTFASFRYFAASSGGVGFW